MLKTETLSLNERITVLNKDISSFKMKYEEILKNVTKFNQGKEKLNDLLSYQKMSHNHYGIGFFEKSSYVSNPYNSFVKKKSNNISKWIKNKFIWIPKNLSIFDKNTYIASYIHSICNSWNYCMLTDGNQIQIGFGFLKVNTLIL